MVRGASPGPAPACQAPGQQLAAHPVQLTDMAPPEAAQESAQGGGRLGYAAESAGRPAGAQHVGVVDAVAARQRRGHQRSKSYRQDWLGLAHRPGPGAGQPVGAGRDAGPGWTAGAARHWPPGGDRRRRCGCGRGWLRGSIYWVLLFLRSLCCYKTIIPEAQKHFLVSSGPRYTPSFGGLGLSPTPRRSRTCCRKPGTCSPRA